MLRHWNGDDVLVGCIKPSGTKTLLPARLQQAIPDAPSRQDGRHGRLNMITPRRVEGLITPVY